jgi:hypothetical protein
MLVYDKDYYTFVAQDEHAMCHRQSCQLIYHPIDPMPIGCPYPLFMFKEHACAVLWD